MVGVVRKLNATVYTNGSAPTSKRKTTFVAMKYETASNGSPETDVPGLGADIQWKSWCRSGPYDTAWCECEPAMSDSTPHGHRWSMQQLR